MERSRIRKEQQFYSRCPPSSNILDVGVANEFRIGQKHVNHFLKHYRYASETYTGLGVNDLSRMPEKYPGKTFITYDGKTFPFADRQFTWIYCNAVIEHVGDRDAQIQFVREMLRVSKYVFFTTPNKYFPIETHTLWPFIHWFDNLFYRIARTRHPWLTPTTLLLLSKKDLRQILLSIPNTEMTITSNRIFGIPMTFSVICYIDEQRIEREKVAAIP